MKNLSLRPVTADEAYKAFNLHLGSDGYLLEVNSGIIVAAKNNETGMWMMTACFDEAVLVRMVPEGEENALRRLKTIAASLLLSDFSGEKGKAIADHLWGYGFSQY